MNQTNIARRSLEKRFSPLRDMQLSVPPRGWLRAIRESLGMTTRQLAKRMQVAPSRVTTLEKAELTGATTLTSLRNAAEAMDCTLVYFILPNTTLDAILYKRVIEKVDKQLKSLHHTMLLENQGLNKDDYEHERQRMINEYTIKLKRLWEDE